MVKMIHKYTKTHPFGSAWQMSQGMAIRLNTIDMTLHIIYSHKRELAILRASHLSIQFISRVIWDGCLITVCRFLRRILHTLWLPSLVSNTFYCGRSISPREPSSVWKNFGSCNMLNRNVSDKVLSEVVVDTNMNTHPYG